MHCLPKNARIVQHPVSDQSRKDLIETATRFLQNLKVKFSLSGQRKEFLELKGLTEEEINEAVKLSGLSSICGPSTIKQMPSLSKLCQTFWLKVFSWNQVHQLSFAAIIVAGVFYGLYSLYKRCLETLKHFKAVQNCQYELTEVYCKNFSMWVIGTLQRMQHNINTMEALVEKQTYEMQNVLYQFLKLAASEEEVEYKRTIATVQALRQDIAIIKGIFLRVEHFNLTSVNSHAVQSRLPTRNVRTASAVIPSTIEGSSTVPSQQNTVRHLASAPVQTSVALNLDANRC